MEKNTKIFSTIVGLIVFFWGLASGYTTLSNNCTKNTIAIKEIQVDRKENNEKIIDAIDGVKDCLGELKTSNAVMIVKISNVKAQLTRLTKKVRN